MAQQFTTVARPSRCEQLLQPVEVDGDDDAAGGEVRRSGGWGLGPHAGKAAAIAQAIAAAIRGVERTDAPGRRAGTGISSSRPRA